MEQLSSRLGRCLVQFFIKAVLMDLDGLMEQTTLDFIWLSGITPVGQIVPIDLCKPLQSCRISPFVVKISHVYSS
jgi:hypothetical protein